MRTTINTFVKTKVQYFPFDHPLCVIIIKMLFCLGVENQIEKVLQTISTYGDYPHKTANYKLNRKKKNK